MALALRTAAKLKPELRLAQAVSEFEAALDGDQKARFRSSRPGTVPTAKDVMRLTAEIDSNEVRKLAHKPCVGTRLTSILQSVQQYSNVVDIFVGGAQNLIASAIWGVLKFSLTITIEATSYFDKLSFLLMNIGRKCPLYENLALLYPRDRELQDFLCEYFVSIVELCKKSILVFGQSKLSLWSSSITKPFDREFGKFTVQFDHLADVIRGRVEFLSQQAQRSEEEKNSSFRHISRLFQTEERARRAWAAKFQFLKTCSTYNHQTTWKQARKKGRSTWVFETAEYKKWKENGQSCVLWMTGILGSGKSVLSANIIDDLALTKASSSVNYFFCRYDDADSLKARTVIGSLARQLLEPVDLEIPAGINIKSTFELGIDEVMERLLQYLPLRVQNHFILLDGLDECMEREVETILDCLKRLHSSKHTFNIYCSGRPDIVMRAAKLLKADWNLSMTDATAKQSSEVEFFVKGELQRRLEAGDLSLGDPNIILEIQDALIQGTQGMFLWVVFQIDSICTERTDEGVLQALNSLPKSLPETFDRILQRLKEANRSDPRFRMSCRRLFRLVAVAQRPLTVHELREAISVIPGDTEWEPRRLVNDMSKVLGCGGSLLVVDEEYLTVHFTHHSVLLHLLSAPGDPVLGDFHLSLRDAHLEVGDVCVTYLNYDIFESQVVKASDTHMRSPITAAVLVGATLGPNLAVTNMALKYLKMKSKPRYDFGQHLQRVSKQGVSNHEPHESRATDHPFTNYAKDAWLIHTKDFTKERGAVYKLFTRLLGGEKGTADLPWTLPFDKDGFISPQMADWFMRNGHGALFSWAHEEAVRRLWNLDDKIILKISQWENRGEATDRAIWPSSTEVQTFNTRLILALHRGINEGEVWWVEAIALTNVGLWESECPSLMTGRFLEYLVHTALLHTVPGGPLEEIDFSRFRFLSERLYEYLQYKESRMDTLILCDGLKLAAYSGHGSLAIWLLDLGVNVNECGGVLHTALQAATLRFYVDLVRLLIERGADVNAVGGVYGTALQAASHVGKVKIATLLLENGADVNLRGGQYGTALYAACANGHEDVAEILIEAGANVNFPDELNFGNALGAACSKCPTGVVRLLLEHGAEVNANKRSDYTTALHFAITATHNTAAQKMEILLEYGADINARKPFGGTPLYETCAARRSSLARVLLNYKDNINWNIDGAEALSVMKSHYSDSREPQFESAEVIRIMEEAIKKMKQGSQVVLPMMRRGRLLVEQTHKYPTWASPFPPHHHRLGRRAPIPEEE